MDIHQAIHDREQTRKTFNKLAESFEKAFNENKFIDDRDFQTLSDLYYQLTQTDNKVKSLWKKKENMEFETDFEIEECEMQWLHLKERYKKEMTILGVGSDTGIGYEVNQDNTDTACVENGSERVTEHCSSPKVNLQDNGGYEELRLYVNNIACATCLSSDRELFDMEDVPELTQLVPNIQVT